MQEFWVTFRYQPGRFVVLVLDTSSSARDPNAVRTEIFKSARAVMEHVPEAMRGELYLLGCPTAFPFTQDTLDRLENDEEAVYPSLITPVFQQIAGKLDAFLVVIGAGQIFDLMDWVSSPQNEILARTIFVAPRQSLTGDLWDEKAAFSPDMLPEGWRERVSTVSLSSPALPFHWDNPAYQWDGAQLKVALPADSSEDLAVSVGYLHPEPAAVHAGVQLQNGGTKSIELTPQNPIASNLQWQTLSLEEAMLFHACIEEGEYLCPSCDRTHVARELYLPCQQTPSKQSSIYPSLRGRRGLVVLQVQGPFVKAHVVGEAGWRTSEPENAAILPSNGLFFLFRFSEAHNQWQRDKEPIEQYQRLGENLYAIFL